MQNNFLDPSVERLAATTIIVAALTVAMVMSGFRADIVTSTFVILGLITKFWFDAIPTNEVRSTSSPTVTPAPTVKAPAPEVPHVTA